MCTRRVLRFLFLCVHWTFRALNAVKRRHTHTQNIQYIRMAFRRLATIRRWRHTQTYYLWFSGHFFLLRHFLIVYFVRLHFRKRECSDYYSSTSVLCCARNIVCTEKEQSVPRYTLCRLLSCLLGLSVPRVCVCVWRFILLGNEKNINQMELFITMLLLVFFSLAPFISSTIHTQCHSVIPFPHGPRYSYPLWCAFSVEKERGKKLTNDDWTKSYKYFLYSFHVVGRREKIMIFHVHNFHFSQLIHIVAPLARIVLRSNGFVLFSFIIMETHTRTAIISEMNIFHVAPRRLTFYWHVNARNELNSRARQRKVIIMFRWQRNV